MSNLYIKMALTNIKNNRRTYIPYILSATITVMLFYIICSLCNNENVGKLWGGNTIQAYMGMGQEVVAIFAVIFLFYVNSFLVKRRMGEFGLYNVLGMEKRHIVKVVYLETIFVFSFVMIVGVLLGVVLDKLMYLVILKILHASIPLGFYVSGKAVCLSLELFGAIFLLLFLNSVRLIYKAKPTELLSSGSVGEKEPKAKWILTILGLICLTAGYAIAVFTTDPVAAVLFFFGAVILVIIGTYLLFTAGSIALLKILKKSKRYYYKTSHFISVSSMMYRMKKNAIGLANICILSTMVLVMISVTLSMFIGVDDAFEKKYPADYSVNSVYGDEDFAKTMNDLEYSIENQGLEIKDDYTYRSLSFSVPYDKEKGKFSSELQDYSTSDIIAVLSDINTFVFVPLDDYNKAMGAHETLADGQILVMSENGDLHGNRLELFGQSFKVKKKLDSFMICNVFNTKVAAAHFVVAKDITVIENMRAAEYEKFGKETGNIQNNGFINIRGDYDVNKTAMASAYYPVHDGHKEADVECKAAEDDNFGVDFVALFFIGIFLGFLFIMATVLIMYYKQITEGYEDRKRFEILQNVGMSQRDVKKSINAQVLIVFFLPLAVAGVHIAFAFPFLFRIMALMNLYDMGLFASCTAGCFLVFALFYTLVYKGTTRLYYGIVKK